MWLTVGNVNIPGIILGLVGLVLVFTAGLGKQAGN
jgi:hypothetical protein